MLMHLAEPAECDGQAREPFPDDDWGSELKEAIASVSRLTAFHPTQTLFDLWLGGLGGLHGLIISHPMLCAIFQDELTRKHINAATQRVEMCPSSRPGIEVRFWSFESCWCV